jgi:hypothetical protein
LWVEEDKAQAQVWIKSGRQDIVDRDKQNVTHFYLTVLALSREVTAGTAPPDLVRVLRSQLPSTGFGTNQTFAAWAEAAQGNCAELGSQGGVAWIEHICQRTGFDYSTSGFRGRIMLAQQNGRTEDRDYLAAEVRLKAASEILKPGQEVLAGQGVRVYLTEVIRMNLERFDRGAIDHELLQREYTKQRNYVWKYIYGEGKAMEEDDDLLSFRDALKEARKPAVALV